MLQNNQIENNDPQQAQGQNQGTNLEQKPEKKRSKPFALKAENFQARNGLKKLYEITSQVNWDDSMTIQSAMNLMTVSLKSWHYQMAPKYSFDYFVKRCQALGSNKFLSAYMNKVRNIHQGRDSWADLETEIERKNQPQQNEEKGMDLEMDLDHQLEIAQKLGAVSSAVKGDREESNKIIGSASEKKDINMQEIDDIMDEDLQMFEEMNRRRAQNHDQDEQGVDIEDDMELGFGIEDGYYD